MRLSSDAKQFSLLFGDDIVGDGRSELAGRVGAQVVLERLEPVKMLKAPQAEEALRRVVAVDMLPIPR